MQKHILRFFLIFVELFLYTTIVTGSFELNKSFALTIFLLIIASITLSICFFLILNKKFKEVTTNLDVLKNPKIYLKLVIKALAKWT